MLWHTIPCEHASIHNLIGVGLCRICGFLGVLNDCRSTSNIDNYFILLTHINIRGISIEPIIHHPVFK